MAEQNAHDDERDTADLVAGDTADLAIDGATDLAVADTARPQAPAEQLTPAGSAVSPFPLALRPRSPQPTALRAARAGCGGSPASPVPRWRFRLRRSP